MTLRFTPAAREQFLAAVEFIMQDNPGAAQTFRERVERLVRGLETFPESGRHLPEFPDLPHREVIVAPYRFFYRIKGENVWIVAVWHSAQIPGEPG